MQHNKAFLNLVDEIRPQVKELSINEVKHKFDQGDNFVFIDVREDSEWHNSRLPHAIHIGKGVIERDIETVIHDKNQEIILYCGGGFRSILAAFNLQKMGYGNVYSMDGGIHRWQEQGLPIDSTSCD